MVETGQGSFLIDTGPDFRVQALRSGISRLDHVLYTHGHADHVLGLDDLRPLSYQRGIDIWADEPTMGYLQSTFAYVFSAKEIPNSRPRLRPHLIHHGKGFEAAGLPILPLKVFHGNDPISAFRFGSVAYITDCSRIPDETWQDLAGLEVLILGALRHQPHPTHFHVAQAVEAARKIGARQTYFTHICHELDHESFLGELPEGMEPAHDGLTLEIGEPIL